MSLTGSGSFQPVVSVAQPGDLPEVLETGEVSREGPAWSANAWAAYVQGHLTENRNAVLLLIRTEERRLCGWLAGTVLGEMAEIDFLLVSPRDRRSGVGLALLQAWREHARGLGATEIFLEVRASNMAALGLYRTAGFTLQGRRKDYYRAPPEDACVMRYCL